MKNYSVWLNDRGDIVWWKKKVVRSENIKEAFIELGCTFIGEVKRFKLEKLSGKGWRSYMEPVFGVQILEVEDGYDTKKCAEEYEDKCYAGYGIE